MVLLNLVLVFSVSWCFVASQLHHHHSGKERESDGAYAPINHGHYQDGEHNTDFDHESILGRLFNGTSLFFLTKRELGSINI